MPKLLDLFCGAGGAAVGYYRAGYTDITGIDNRPQKHYPFRFIQADALEYLAEHGREYDVIHASPPCQAFSVLEARWRHKMHSPMVDITRIALIETRRPFVIENVPGAPLEHPIMLCGTMFSLQTAAGRQLWRHRFFESNLMFGLVPPCQHRGSPATVTGHSGGTRNRDGRRQPNSAERMQAMGIDWMNGDELSQAIPPAYTLWIGKQLMKTVARLPRSCATSSARLPASAVIGQCVRRTGTELVQTRITASCTLSQGKKESEPCSRRSLSS